jgi:glucokinase
LSATDGAAHAEGLVAGIDVGGTKVLGVVLDPVDPTRVVAQARVPTPAGTAPLLDAMSDVVRKLGDEHPIASVGVGIAGLVDREGVLRVSPNLPGLVDVRVGHEVDARLGLPVRVENDATCAVWGEHLAGAARGASDVLLVALGTGIGAGVVTGRVLLRGAHGFGGEAGHMVVEAHGRECPCGRRGCWERYASGSGLGFIGREAALANHFGRGIELAGDPEQVRGEHVSRAAAEGDADALAILDQFADWVALGVGNLLAVLDSSLVVIGGGLVDIGDLLLDPVRAALPARMMAPEHRDDVRVVAAELGEEAGAIGAALLGWRDRDTSVPADVSAGGEAEAASAPGQA